jgi:hypothetical protein
MFSQGNMNVVALHLTPTLWGCMCNWESNMLPYLTYREKQIMAVKHVEAHTISMTVRLPSSHISGGA